ncbi:kynureninase [Parvularcula lutaonensis]|uniref:Kynureninase n=1 Tax=Parvularcula lutaonensis TaxID=491923 RepID=A0ABV7MCV4_9PROT|nr:aminotransferase class V-fold PLP-dependent enzyme [Parvularcula lutaonensis]GGY40139.1 kynureninase [Parvularcula lutaonensis]
MTRIPTSRAEAEALDAADPLAPARARFRLPEGVTYLVGHSLGPATEMAIARAEKTATEEWANGIVRSWNTAGWIDLGQSVGARIARLIGAKPEEVVVCDSVSVNLFKLAVAALPLAKERRVMVEDDEFPTDQYMTGGIARTTGAAFDHLPAGEGIEALAKGGVLIKSAVNYRTAEIIDMAAFEQEARRTGAVIVWDLSHAGGIVPVKLNDSGALFATGCTYKYMNGGPGAPSYLYVAAGIVGEVHTPLPGWLGHAQPFAFSKEYQPAEGVSRFVAGTPTILSLSALDGALDAFDGIEIGAVHGKAQALGDLCSMQAATFGLTLGSPAAGERRGGHVSLRHQEGYAVTQALAARGILSDFRTPDTIRFGLSPLFLRYTDVWDTVAALGDILEHRLWDRPEFKVRAKVT